MNVRDLCDLIPKLWPHTPRHRHRRYIFTGARVAMSVFVGFHRIDGHIRMELSMPEVERLPCLVVPLPRGFEEAAENLLDRPLPDN